MIILIILILIIRIKEDPNPLDGETDGKKGLDLFMFNHMLAGMPLHLPSAITSLKNLTNPPIMRMRSIFLFSSTFSLQCHYICLHIF